jgi:hypothetical protein
VKLVLGLACIGGLVLLVAIELSRTDRTREHDGAAALVAPMTSAPMSAFTPAPTPAIVPERRAPDPSPSPAAAQEPVEAPVPLRQCLEEYWGARWPEQEAKMRAAGLDLEQACAFEPWEEVAPLFEAHLLLDEAERESHVLTLLEWPQEPTGESIGRALSARIPEEDVATVVQIAEPYNARIRDLGALWADSLEDHMLDAWAAGRYQKAPFSTVGLEAESGAFHVQSFAGAGWTAIVMLTEEECPGMMQIRDEIDGLRDERRAAVLSYVRR